MARWVSVSRNAGQRALFVACLPVRPRDFERIGSPGEQGGAGCCAKHPSVLVNLNQPKAFLATLRTGQVDADLRAIEPRVHMLGDAVVDL